MIKEIGAIYMSELKKWPELMVNVSTTMALMALLDLANDTECSFQTGMCCHKVTDYIPVSYQKIAALVINFIFGGRIYVCDLILEN